MAHFRNLFGKTALPLLSATKSSVEASGSSAAHSPFRSMRVLQNYD